MTHKASILPLFMIISHFECRLNRRFWRSKKVVQVVQGEGGNWTKSKRTAAFFGKPSFTSKGTQQCYL